MCVLNIHMCIYIYIYTHIYIYIYIHKLIKALSMSKWYRRKFAKPPFAKGVFQIRLGGSLASFWRGCSCTKRASVILQMPKTLKILKLGSHPHTKPTSPRGGFLNCRYRCLQRKRPLQKRTPRLSNPLPQNIYVDEVKPGSRSACKIRTTIS